MSEIVRLNTKQTNALNALVRGETVSSAAAAAGVNERQVYRWLKDETFAGELKRRKGEMLRLAGLRLAGLAAAAVRVLGELLEGPYQAGSGIRLRAAIAVLELIDRWRNSDDFDERLTNLERQVLHDTE